jgi:hypothetical protein
LDPLVISYRLQIESAFARWNDSLRSPQLLKQVWRSERALQHVHRYFSRDLDSAEFAAHPFSSKRLPLAQPDPHLKRKDDP